MQQLNGDVILTGSVYGPVQPKSDDENARVNYESDLVGGAAVTPTRFYLLEPEINHCMKLISLNQNEICCAKIN